MSNGYNPNRNEKWSYGGDRWRLSRSKVDLFLECPRCFYIDNKLGTARPPGYPFSLNAAVDHLLKKEFDVHRAEGSVHPLMEEYNIDLVPYEHPDIDKWRENFKGVETKHEPTGFTISGAIDDVWVDKKTGELYVVDYKATSKDATPTLDAKWQDSYKRQMEVYQWLLRQNGHKVSNTGYFVYANGKRDEKAFDGKLEFEVVIIPYEGDDGWLETTLGKIKENLESSKIPDVGEDCDYCKYREAVALNIRKHIKNNDKEGDSKGKKVSKKDEQGTLF